MHNIRPNVEVDRIFVKISNLQFMASRPPRMLHHAAECALGIEAFMTSNFRRVESIKCSIVFKGLLL